jgi:hypothetical protein
MEYQSESLPFDDIERLLTSIEFFEKYGGKKISTMFLWFDQFLDDPSFKIKPYEDDGFIFIYDNKIEEYEPYKSYGLDLDSYKEWRELMFIKANQDKMSRLQRTIFDGNEEDEEDEDKIIELIDELGPLCFPNHIDKTNSTALIWACQKEMPKVANKLIDTFGKLCVPGQHDNSKSTALAWACCGTGDEEKNKLMEQVAIKIVKTFNSGGKSVPIEQFYSTSCNPYLADEYGFTPLDLACREGMVDAALEILNTFKTCGRGFDGLFRNKQTLINTCFNGMGEVVQRLVERFERMIDQTLVDEFNHSALYYAFSKCGVHVAKLLLDTYGVDCVVGDFEDCENSMGQLFDDWYNEYKKDKCRNKLYDLGFLGGNLEHGMSKLQKLILDYNKRGNQSLVVAKIWNWLDELGEELMNYLISHVDHDCNTALILATYFDMDVVATCLIRTFGQTCKPEYCDQRSNPAIYYAHERCGEGVVRLMLDTYGEDCIGGKFMDVCKNKEGVLFDDWYKKEYKGEKEEKEDVPPNIQVNRYQLVLNGQTLDSIEECGKFLQQLVIDPINNSKETEMVMHFMKYLTTV